MKTLMKCILVVAVLLCTQLASGQEKEIQEVEYYRALPDTYFLMQKESIRIIKIGEYFKNGSVYKTDKLVEESLPPGRMRAYEETTEGKLKTTKEAIKISDKSFCKEGKGPWTLSQYMCAGSGMSGVDANSEMSYYKSTEDVDGKRVTRYRFIAKEPRRQNTPPNFPDVFEYITWIDANGRILKKERKTSLSSTGEIIYNGKETYEYNPKDVKIVAPIK